jgi:hypothetical protein
MGHGDRWSAFHSDGFQHAMPLLFPGGTVITGRSRMFDTPAGRFERTPSAIFGRNGLFGLCAIVMALENEGQRTLMTAYPFPVAGVGHRVTIDSITEDCLGLEGWINADTETGFPVTFFASDYFVNSHRYTVGATIDVILGGLAYKAGTPPTGQVEITDPAAIEKYRAAGMIDDTDDETISVRYDEAAILLPLDGWEPFDYLFQGKIKSTTTDVSGEHLQALVPVMSMGGAEFNLKILCTKSRMLVPPVGEFIGGNTCVMGHIADFAWPEHRVA